MTQAHLNIILPVPFFWDIIWYIPGWPLILSVGKHDWISDPNFSTSQMLHYWHAWICSVLVVLEITPRARYRRTISIELHFQYPWIFKSICHTCASLWEVTSWQDFRKEVTKFWNKEKKLWISIVGTAYQWYFALFKFYIYFFKFIHWVSFWRHTIECYNMYSICDILTKVT